LIGELLDAVETMHGADARRALTIEHPLQPFSPRAFGVADDGQHLDPRRWSYRDEWRLPSTGERRPPAPFVAADFDRHANDAERDDERAPEPPDRDALQRFFRNPAQWWLQRRLGLRLPDSEEAERDREPLGENVLVRHRAIADLLDDALALERDTVERDDDETVADDIDHGIGDARTHLAARTLLPPGRDGDTLCEVATEVAKRLLAARAEVRSGDAPRTVAAHGDDAPHGIAFAFDDVDGDTRAVATAGKLNADRRVRAGIDHLLLASVLGETATTILIGEGKREASKKRGEGDEADPYPIERRVWRGIDRDTARARLATLLALWREGQDGPLPFAPKTSFAYAEALVKKDLYAAWATARAAFDPYGDFGGDADDAWIALAFRPHGGFHDVDDTVAQRFRAVAAQVFAATEPSE
ncbi:MAG: hypothetical protein IT473_09280, partial [Lysobacter sp.]|nr:hypothetical protein [Lysobacter sp.]